MRNNVRPFCAHYFLLVLLLAIAAPAWSQCQALSISLTGSALTRTLAPGPEACRLNGPYAHEYHFTVPENEEVVIRVETKVFAPQLILGQGNPLKQIATGSASGSGSAIDRQLHAGAYRLWVSGTAPNDQGAYKLSVWGKLPCPPQQLEFPSIHNGSLSSSCQGRDRSIAQQFHVKVVNVGKSIIQIESGQFDPWIVLADERGNPIMGDRLKITANLLAGMYTLNVKSLDRRPGRFTLRLSGPCTPTSLPLLSKAQGRLSAEDCRTNEIVDTISKDRGPVRQFAVAVEHAGKLTADVTSSEFQPSLQVLNEAGKTAIPSASVLKIGTLARLSGDVAAGKYLILVSANDDRGGAFTLTTLLGQPDCKFTHLRSGPPRKSVLAVGGCAVSDYQRGNPDRSPAEGFDVDTQPGDRIRVQFTPPYAGEAIVLRADGQAAPAVISRSSEGPVEIVPGRGSYRIVVKSLEAAPVPYTASISGITCASYPLGNASLELGSDSCIMGPAARAVHQVSATTPIVFFIQVASPDFQPVVSTKGFNPPATGNATGDDKGNLILRGVSGPGEMTVSVSAADGGSGRYSTVVSQCEAPDLVLNLDFEQKATKAECGSEGAAYQYYRVVLKTPGTLHAAISSFSTPPRISLLDGARAVIASDNAPKRSGRGYTAESARVKVSPGSYLVRAGPFSRQTAQTYTLRPVFFPESAAGGRR